MHSPVPITAFALSCSLGRTADDAYEALLSGQRHLRPSPFDVPFETSTGAVSFALPPLKVPERDSRAARLAQVALSQLEGPIADLHQKYDKSRVGIFVGTSTGGIDRTEEAYEQWWNAGQSGPLPSDFNYPIQHPFHTTSDFVAQFTGFTGPRFVISTACSSSSKVFASARRLIELGVIDAAIVGGVDALCHTTVRGFHGLGVMAAEPCRPFGQDRPGMNVGEGAAYLVLEREASEDRPALAWLRGVGESSDAYHMSSPQPEGHGAFAAMTQALEDAELSPGDVDFINAHGTGTRHNDISESKAIERLFGRQVPVVSTKAYTGHTLGACGAVEAILCILSLNEGMIPAALGAYPVDPEIHIKLPKKPIHGPIRYALSNAFAFGGNNCSVLLEAP